MGLGADIQSQKFMLIQVHVQPGGLLIVTVRIQHDNSVLRIGSACATALAALNCAVVTVARCMLSHSLGLPHSKRPRGMATIVPLSHMPFNQPCHPSRILESRVADAADGKLFELAWLHLADFCSPFSASSNPSSEEGTRESISAGHLFFPGDDQF